MYEKLVLQAYLEFASLFQVFIYNLNFYFSNTFFSSEMEYILTSRGGRKLLLGGFSYILDQKNNTTYYWRCSEITSCSARVIVVDEAASKGPSEYSHPPDCGKKPSHTNEKCNKTAIFRV